MDLLGILKNFTQTAQRTEGEAQALVKGAMLRATVVDQKADGTATLKIGARLIQVALEDALALNREIKVQVVQTSPKLILQLVDLPEPSSESASKPGPLNPDGQKPDPRPVLSAQITGLPDGRHLRLKVVQPPTFPSDPTGRVARIFQAGREITARLASSQTDANLAPGKTVRFFISEISPQLVLEPVSQGSGGRDGLQLALASFLARPGLQPADVLQTLDLLTPSQNLSQDLIGRLELFRNVLSELSPQGPDPDPGFLGRLVQRLGLNPAGTSLKEEITGLFQALIRNAEAAKPEAAGHLRLLADNLGTLFDAAAGLQQLNQETIREFNMVHLTFPFFWMGEQGQGELAFKKEGSKKGSGHPRKATLLLNLSRLGRIKADLGLENQKISGVLQVEKEETRKLLNQKINEFKAAMSARGYRIEALNIRLFPKNHPPPHTLAEELVTPTKGLINIQV